VGAGRGIPRLGEALPGGGEDAFRVSPSESTGRPRRRARGLGLGLGLESTCGEGSTTRSTSISSGAAREALRELVTIADPGIMNVQFPEGILKNFRAAEIFGLFRCS